MTQTIRTRFAPSPTGYLHVGGIRTALFAYLLARQSHGEFILRFEDTDKKREVPGSAEHLIASLKAIGISYDEGPDIGGPYGPYIQSQRLDHYKTWAQKLIDTGRAYADPHTPEEMQTFREQAIKDKRAFLVRDHRPENPPTWDGSQPLRLKSEPRDYDWHDEVMGDMHTPAGVVDDIVLIKSDGYPTYNFAHIIDDLEMNISHVIRGQEFLSSMGSFLNIYDALGIDYPLFAHMPHIMNEQGNKKLGKRDGAKDVLDYIRDGYLPEAMMSFIATMGWNDGTEQEIFNHDELVEKFSLDRVQKSGARFDERRLLWMNGQLIRELSLDDLFSRVADFWPASAQSADDTQKKHVLSLAQDRLKTLRDLPIITDYFFADPIPDWTMIDDNKQLRKAGKSALVELLRAAHAALETSEFTPDALQETLNNLLETTGEKPGILFSIIRLAVSWAPFSPALPDTLAALGQETTLRRLQTAIDSVA